jgi:prephenate dehydrogenase
MSDYSYNLWKLHELTSSDPRMYLDIIVTNAKYNKIQAIQYRDDTVFVISEEQYKRLTNC